jgi:hypothetical protein
MGRILRNYRLSIVLAALFVARQGDLREAPQTKPPRGSRGGIGLS